LHRWTIDLVTIFRFDHVATAVDPLAMRSLTARSAPSVSQLGGPEAVETGAVFTFRR
jgi:hypothetical protein